MSKKSIFILFSVILFLTLTVYFLVARHQPIQPGTQIVPEGQTHEVILTENGFNPQEITIKPGDLIKFSTTLSETFWPASDLHPTHGIYPEFDPQEPIDPDNSWTVQFLKTGKWKYHDHLQPMFRGIIIVQ